MLEMLEYPDSGKEIDMIKRRYLIAPALALALAVQHSSSAAQAETSTFTYDALGRLVEVESERSAETVTHDFTYDDANNRTEKVVTETASSADAAPLPEASTAIVASAGPSE